ncbi:MAG: hypothetical protein V9G10_16115 [Candidatus Nanopelagicales bacterium]
MATVLPFTVRGAGSLRGGQVQLDASASSQFVSGLLLSAASMDRGLELHHVGPPLPSAPHVEMTVAMLAQAGVTVEGVGDEWHVDPAPVQPQLWEIEPDLSNAGPFLAAAMVTGSTVTIPGWPAHTTQAGDYWREFLPRLGATLQDNLTVTGPGSFDGFDVDLRAVGELTPTIAALAACANTPSQLRGIGHLRGHETDRLQRYSDGTDPHRDHSRRDQRRPADRSGRPARAQHRNAADLCRPPHGDHGRDPGAAGRGLAGGRPRDHGQDHARFRVALGRHARVSREWDEDDVRVRPGRRSRPRSKQRPTFDDAIPGTVIAVDRGRFTCLAQDREVLAVRARHVGRKGLVVGDHVRIDGPLPEGDALVRIVSREPRRDGSAPDRRRHRRHGTRDRGQRRPTGDRDGLGRSRAEPGLHRPMPGRGLRRRDRTVADPDEGRPRLTGVTAGPVSGIVVRGVHHASRSRPHAGDRPTATRGPGRP